jgi:methionine synthase I (cobalamin-dependent)
MAQLLERLAAGEVLVLDGAIGTEIQRRGVPMDTEAWCGIANLSHPEVVVEVHADYLRAGADIVTANTFATARHVLEASGLGEETVAANRAAMRHARRAVEVSGREGIVVAGSISSMAPLGDWRSPPYGEEVAAAYREQAEVLAEAGADVLLAEMMLDLPNTALVVEAASATGLPLLVGWSASPDREGGAATYRLEDDADYRPEPFSDLVRRGVGLGGDVHGIMHSSIDVTTPALAALAEHWDGPTMAYPETGRFEPPDWVFTEELEPGSFASEALDWVGAGVGIVGGCCGTTPQHIAAVAAALEESR